MSTLSEGYVYHMFSLFLCYLNSKQTLFKSYLINKLFPVPFYYVNSISVLCIGYVETM